MNTNMATTGTAMGTNSGANASPAAMAATASGGTARLGSATIKAGGAAGACSTMASCAWSSWR